MPPVRMGRVEMMRLVARRDVMKWGEVMSCENTQSEPRVFVK